MYFILGRSACLDTIRDVSGAAGAMPAKAAYRRWLGTKVDAVALGPDGSDDPELVFDAVVERELTMAFVASGGADDDGSSLSREAAERSFAARDAAAIEEKLSRLRRAYGDLAETDEDLFGVFRLVVNRVFVAEIEGDVSGSSPRHTGAFFGNPPSGATRWDLVELFVHELTHQLLFLDEQLHGWQRRSARELRPLSTIKKTPRPFRAVLHSLVVALEIAALRRRFPGRETSGLVHPSTDALVDSCGRTIRSITDIAGWEEHLRPRGRMLVEACRRSWLEASAGEAAA